MSQEVPLLGEADLAELRDKYVRAEGDDPREQIGASDAQLTALKFLLDQGLTPYADFGVFLPHGARQERRHKFLYQFMDSGGRWHAAEQAGPSCLESWRQCWAVYSVAAVMLGIATPATLAHYGGRFEERAHRYPRSWYSCVVAGNRCRSEFFTAERRRQERFAKDHPGMSAYKVDMPWETVMREAAVNVDFWLRELQEPAMLYDGTRGTTTPSWTNQQLDQQYGTKRDYAALQGGPSLEDQAALQKDAQREVCKNYNRGKCDFTKCRRIHICSTCQGNHPSIRCPQNAEKGDRGDKGKGKGKRQKKKKGEKGFAK